MTDYTKSTNFLAKDSLPETDSGKIIKGSEFDTEFNALQTAIATKADKASPTFTGIPAAPTASAGTNTTQLATTEFVISAADRARTYSNLQTFKDTAFEVVDDADTSKKLNLQLSGITTATTRTLTVPNKNGTIAVTTDLTLADPLNASSNTIVSGSYAVTSSTTITFTATNTYTAGQSVFIQFTNTSGSALTNDNFTIVSATGSNFTITYGSSVTSAGTFTATRYGIVSLATPADLSVRTDTLRPVTSSNLVVTRSSPNAGGTTPFPSTSGPSSVTYTGIPSWVKRITVLFSGVSTSGSSNVIVRIGAGSILTTGYLSTSWQGGSGDTGNLFTTGFGIDAGSSSAYLRTGKLVLTNISENNWIGEGVIARQPGVSSAVWVLGGNVTLSGTLDRVSVTTSNGTDLFDAGIVNLLLE